MKNALKPIIPFFSITILCLLTVMVYYPGLSGGFIFDDYHSLKILAVFNGEFSFDGLMEYIGLSDTGPLKRPISILTFLFDAQNWPAEPYAFKRTNLIIHLINGCLLYGLIIYLFKYQVKWQKSRYFIALFSAGIWLLHPFMVSTTLYVVQRMAMLPLSFMLIGFLLFTYARVNYSKLGEKVRVLLLLLAVFGMTFFAMLSKENGVLYLFLVALYELFVIQKLLGIEPLTKKTKFWLLTLPVYLLIAALLIKLPSFMASYDVRNFTAFDRLISEMRVLTDYIYQLLMPQYFTYGVFTDGFKMSESLLQPISTLFSTLFILGLLVMAWLLRNRFIWLSFAVFFYFVAHVLESTIIPLELYFEHRNYIAALFLPVPLVLLLTHLYQKSRIYFIIPLALMGFLSFTTYLKTSLWGNNFRLHEMTMMKYPESLRASTQTADFYDQMGYKVRALEILTRATNRHEDLGLNLKHAILLCDMQQLTDEHFDLLITGFIKIEFNSMNIDAFTGLYQRLLNQECQSINTETKQAAAKELLEALKNNTFNHRSYAKKIIKHYDTMKLIETGEYSKSLTMLIEAHEENHDYSNSVKAIVMLVSKGANKEALNLTRYLQKQYSSSSILSIDWENKKENLTGIEQQILQLMAESKP